MPNPSSARHWLGRRAVLVVNRLSRLLGRGQGTVAGGRVGLRLDPQLLHHLATGRRIALVTGTNGKTTTTALLRAGWGPGAQSNETGANMLPGMVASLAASPAREMVLECDEAWLGAALAATNPAVIVLLNLSRDQLDRANEVRAVAARWRAALANVGGVVVANVNDPLVVYAAEVATTVRWCDVYTGWREDAATCPRCDRALEDLRGDWHCVCGFARPVPTSSDDPSSIEGQSVQIELALPGLVNRGNATMALAALASLGVAPDVASPRLAVVRDVSGRYARRNVGGRDLRLLLAKNPAGFRAALSMLDDRDRTVWIAINDEVADGRDPSWLYDVPFEVLVGRRVYCTGTRREDLATRLFYAGVEATLGEPPRSESVATFLGNYTAFQQVLRTSVLP